MMQRILIAGLAAALIGWSHVPASATPAASARVTAGTAGTETASLVARAQQRTWEWKGRIASGKAIEVKGVNGAVRAERSSGQEVEVVARLRGKRDDPDEVRMEVVEHDGGVTICAVYPTRDRDEPNQCRPGHGGRNKVDKNDVKVEFSVRVPEGVTFVGRTVNGSIDARGLDGDVRVSTVNGGIDVSTTGLVEASAVNGSITASLGRANWDGELDFTTVNGSVTLELPEELHTNLNVSTVNGRISTDFPVTVRGRFSPRRLSGTIGDGGRELTVKTVNGSIQLRRS